MDVGIQMVFSSAGWSGVSDGEVYAEEVQLARPADDLGFDVLWAVEYHFHDYSFCPDNTQLLAYLAGVTDRIDVGTAAIILPWNDPLRVAEKVALLDQLTQGRLRLGLGRGLSRREFAGFRGVEMEESRGRFDESAAMVLSALATGTIEGDGPYYPQPPVAIRPEPRASFDGRTYVVANSDDSVESAAKFGAAMVMFADRPWEHRLASVQRWRARFEELQGRPPPRPLVCDFVYCSADSDGAERSTRRYMGAYLESVLDHYEIAGSHFATTDGYEQYAKAAAALQNTETDQLLNGFLRATAHGTPDEILETLRVRRELLGDYELAVAFRFGGIPLSEATAGMRLFAAEILPELQRW